MPFGVLPAHYLKGVAQVRARCSQSPLPFGVLPAHYPTPKHLVVERSASPLPFGVLPAHYLTGVINDARMMESPLPFGVLPAHYLGRIRRQSFKRRLSPLPFGVLPAHYWWSARLWWSSNPCLHCLSAFCPLTTWSESRRSHLQLGVSIAFRRFARSLRKLSAKRGSLPNVSIAFRRFARSLHG